MGDFADARRRFEEALPVCRELGDRQSGAVVLFNLGRAAAALGELPSAEGYYQRSLVKHQALGEQRGVAFCLEGLAALLASGGQPRPAARLYGAAEAIRERIGVPSPA